MNLRILVDKAFAPEGPLANAVDGFVARTGQIDMAHAVSDVLETGGALVVEAGTGIGKTLAYLVPALLSGERVVVSTASKALQDQLHKRDLPLLLATLGVPVQVAMLKGRSSYLCLHRLTHARQNARLDAPLDDRLHGKKWLHDLASVESWAQVTRTGDLAELPALAESSTVMPWVTSTRENCLGAECPQLKSCHVNLARREALAADVVVINHHLFFADLAVRESGVAELLPSVRAVIFDEAHQLNDVGIQFLGVVLSSGHFQAFCRDMLATGLQAARGLADWHSVVGLIELAVHDLRILVDTTRQLSSTSMVASRIPWRGDAPEGIDPGVWQAQCRALSVALESALAALDSVSELNPAFVRLYERGGELMLNVAHFAVASSEGAVRWLDLGLSSQSAVRWVESPLNIAQGFRSRRMESAKGSEREQSWIFTSATLGHDDRLSWFTQACGLTDAQILRVGSPFNYQEQASLYVPIDFPKPIDPAHSAHVAALAISAVTTLGGRCLVLTTTLKALRVIGEALDAHFKPKDDVEVLVQGRWPKRRLMERFRQGNDPSQRGCVLVGSVSFWEGFDVPGDALQLVIVDKLPFPPPHDPLVEARAQRIEAQGRSAFADYFVPEAAVALKQGAGRLIRQESDRGVLVVCDTRLVTMGYGKRIRSVLPPMRWLATATAFDEALQALVTRASTKATEVS